MAVRGSLYAFMLERLHVARRAFIPGGRWRDWVWLIGMTIVLASVAGILFTLFYEKLSVTNERGICKLVLSDTITFVVCGLDGFLTIGLTIVFVALLLPAARSRRQNHARLASEETITDVLEAKATSQKQAYIWVETIRILVSGSEQPHDPLSALIRKTIKASLIISIAILMNLVILKAVFRGHEPAAIYMAGLGLDG